MCAIAAIIPYYENAPRFFNFFTHSGANNTLVRFFIISDEIEDNKNIPGNVFILNKTFQ